jgi:hypothetical protein
MICPQGNARYSPPKSNGNTGNECDQLRNRPNSLSKVRPGLANGLPTGNEMNRTFSTWHQAWAQAALCAGLMVAGPGIAETPVDDSVCTGVMANGMGFSARVVGGLFEDLVWTRAGQPDRTSELSYFTTNAEGQTVWRGAFDQATKVLLVDLSGGAVRTDSSIAVYAEEWGWADGTCRGPAAEADAAATVLRSLIGLRDTQATNWLRRNGFSRVRTVAHSGTGKTERWSQPNRPLLEVVFEMGFVSDVLPATP